VAPPSHPGTACGHYSRWEASPTTFGPAIKVGVSFFLVGVLVLGLFLVFFILLFVQLFLTGWILKELWRPAWVAPTTSDRDRSPAVAALVLLAIAGAALVTIFAVGTDEMRLGAIMLATLLGMYAFFRSFLD